MYLRLMYAALLNNFVQILQKFAVRADVIFLLETFDTSNHLEEALLKYPELLNLFVIDAVCRESSASARKILQYRIYADAQHLINLILK